jgi:hypothetical protein
MKNTLADNKQLFNVRAIANSKTLDNLVDGEFGVFAEGATTSLAATTVFAALPEKFRFVSKEGGKVYYSFDTITKASIANATEQAYSAAAVNVWEGVIASAACDSISTATLRINLDEESLMRERGLSWGNMDSTVVSAPDALTAQCVATGNPVYDNQVITQTLVGQVNSSASPFYLAKAKYDITGVPGYMDQAALDTAEPNPDTGNVAKIITDGTLNVYTGVTWVVVGEQGGVLTTDGMAILIVAQKTRNTDGTAATDGAYLTFILEGKPAAARNYKDLDVNHIFPRGVRLTPAVKLNGEDGPAIAFTETQSIAYELGAGADLRAAEFESMSLYTNLNFYPQLSDGLASEDLVYQFENGVNYNTVDFEFSTDKVNRNDGDKRNFGVMLATQTGSVFTALKALIGA